MILVKDIEKLIEQQFEGSDKFIVEVRVSPINNISVEFDADNGVSIQDCKSLNRFLESELDREEIDFSMTISSAGLDKPLRNIRQYQKNIGRSVKVTKIDGSRLQGKLEAVQEEKLVINSLKKKEKEAAIIEVPINEIKETKVIISFK